MHCKPDFNQNFIWKSCKWKPCLHWPGFGNPAGPLEETPWDPFLSVTGEDLRQYAVSQMAIFMMGMQSVWCRLKLSNFDGWHSWEPAKKLNVCCIVWKQTARTLKTWMREQRMTFISSTPGSENKFLSSCIVYHPLYSSFMKLGSVELLPHVPNNSHETSCGISSHWLFHVPLLTAYWLLP